MSVDISTKITVKKALTSKISEVDFDNLPFGQVTTDHMFVCDYKDGKMASAPGRALSKY